MPKCMVVGDPEPYSLWEEVGVCVCDGWYIRWNPFRLRGVVVLCSILQWLSRIRALDSFPH